MSSVLSDTSQQQQRRLSMSGDSQWIPEGGSGAGHGRRRSSSGYALSPTLSSFSTAQSTLAASSPIVTSSKDAAHPPAVVPGKRQLNPASIFQRLGLLNSPTGAVGADPSSPALASPTPGILGQEREDSHLATEAFDGLGLEEDGGVSTPRPGNDAVSSYMDASPSIGSSALSSRQHSRETTGTTSSSDASTSNTSPSLPSGMVAIEADIILPFADRPAEIKDLLEHEGRNRGLYDLLRETFTPRTSGQNTASPTRPTLSISSPSEWTWSDLLAHLSTPRSELCDQDFIDTLKAHVYPRSHLLWERLRACLGVDVDDERGGDRYEELSSDIMHHEDPEGSGIPPSYGRNMGGFFPPSPRAVLRNHNQLQQQESMFGGNNSSGLRQPAPSLSLGGISPNSFSSSSAGFSGMSVSPAGGNVELPTATQEHPNPFSPIRQQPRALHVAASPTASGTSSPRFESGSRSPSRELTQSQAQSQTQASAAAPRNHRRTSSGSSGFRRSMQMSSINEDAPVEDFSTPESDNDGSLPPPPPPGQGLTSPAMTPSNSYGSDLASASKAIDFGTVGQHELPGRATSGAAKVGLGDLLRLRGHPLDYNAPLTGSALTTSSSASSLSSLAGAGSPFSTAPGHLPPPTPLSPSLGSASSLGLTMGSSPTRAAAPVVIGSSGMGRGNSRSPVRDRERQGSYTGYSNVFDSEDGESIGGRSTGRGPGMRFSFSESVEPSSPQAPTVANRPKASGFALAGLSFGNKKSATSSPDPGSGTSTPKGGSDSGKQ